MKQPVTFLPIASIPQIRRNDDLSSILAPLLQAQSVAGDILVVTHKIVSKAEGSLVDLGDITPSALASSYAQRWNKDARQVEVVLQESQRIVRMAAGLIISETRHGFVCANAGVDLSNVAGGELACLLPKDPDAAARRLHQDLTAHLGFSLPVIISDSFGRPWRNGIVNVAIGVAGLEPLTDYRGLVDAHGYTLNATIMATADALAAGAELVMGKTDEVPVALVRGFQFSPGEMGADSLVMEASRNLFP